MNDTPSMPQRRLVLAIMLSGTLGACTPPEWMSFGQSGRPVPSRAERLIRMVDREGVDKMFAPEALRVMGLNNGMRDVPVKQLARDDASGRHVVSVTTIRGRAEVIFHRRQGNLLVFHLANSALVRTGSATYPRHGRPARMADGAGDIDYRNQLAFWMERIPGR
ncbi:MAG: hypothetical protein KF889_17235 [Alphaproteobacteria bacterium]|nr:hypothetical protein [Alphaproteobacteria bacterium]MCW5739886.1 hypothetical protein [Alphaproteobacteria bacterium]